MVTGDWQSGSSLFRDLCTMRNEATQIFSTYTTTRSTIESLGHFIVVISLYFISLSFSKYWCGVVWCRYFYLLVCGCNGVGGCMCIWTFMDGFCWWQIGFNAVFSVCSWCPPPPPIATHLNNLELSIPQSVTLVNTHITIIFNGHWISKIFVVLLVIIPRDLTKNCRIHLWLALM